MEPFGRQYSRKDKSLGLLVIKFLNLYNRDGVDLIGLDDAAGKLGVERRRIYDVVNILESIGLVARRGKNQYSWLGFGEVPRALNELKEAGMREKTAIVPYAIDSEMVVYDQVKVEPLQLTPDDQENSPSPKLDVKKEKCLWNLAQNFVKLFLCSESDDDLITLDGASKALLNDPQEPMNMRTKVRRLYDIANVFSSMKLIEKTQIPESKKAAYRWLGYEAMLENNAPAAPAPAPASLCARNEPKKRAFGTELTNVNTKRNKTDGSKDLKPYGNQNTSVKIEQEEGDVKPDLKKSSVSGPITPAETSKMNNNIGRRLVDLERLSATFRPQYCNPELFGLLGHYNETWKTWHAEVRKK